MKARDDTAERPREPVCLSGAGRVTAPAAAVAIFSDAVEYGAELPAEGETSPSVFEPFYRREMVMMIR